MSTVGMLDTDLGSDEAEVSEHDVLTIDDDKTDEVLSSVSSETAREVLGLVHESARTSTEIADELGTTTQNIRYHLDKLEEAGLVEVGDICYSKKGREMSVYQPSGTLPVIVFGVGEDESGA